MHSRAVRCHRLSFTVSVLLLGGITAAAHAAPLASLVKELNTTHSRTLGYHFPPPPVAVGTTLFFAADDGGTGSELWKIDSPGATPTLVRDICPGSCPSAPSLLTAFNGRLYFRATDGIHGYELWESDGTAAGTFMVRDIYPGPQSSLDNWITVAGGTLLFAADDGVHGMELWESDGTAAGTRLVADMFPGATGSNPGLLATAGGRVLLYANDDSHGTEPWISDGTAAGTHFVRGLNPAGLSIAGPYTIDFKPIAVGLPDGSFLFGANDGTHGYEPWRTDGTQAGTVLVSDLNPGAADSSPNGFTAFAGKVYFQALNADFTVELWGTDGTAIGTAGVANLGPGFGSFPTAILNSQLFFGFKGLWKTDGTAGGTVQVKPGLDQLLMSLNGNSLMILSMPSGGDLGVWKSDGTTAGTVLVKSFGQQSCQASSVVYQGSYLFYQCTGESQELWKSDGTPAGTVFVQGPAKTPSFPVTTWFSIDAFLEPHGSGLFFSADDGVSGAQVWHTDGSAAGTLPVPGITAAGQWPVLGGRSPVPLGSAVIYGGGGLLWRTDGTSSGTEQLLATGVDPWTLQRAGNLVFFRRFVSGSNGGSYQLWKTDGTAAGTTLVKDAAPTFLPSLGSLLLFFANGNELWRTDGTDVGTLLLKHLPPEFDGSSAAPTLVGDLLFFIAPVDSSSWGLWKTDGTDVGTVPVKSLPGGLDRLIAAGRRLFLADDDRVLGRELWTSDGTDAGTHLVKAFLRESTPFFFDRFAASGSLLFFMADDGVHGRELWVSDGTDAGTHLVKDVRPGSESSGPGWVFVAAGNRLFFTADDGVHGTELWVSDGTDAGTHLVQDILPGPESSMVTEAAVVGSSLVFSATDGVHGAETWVTNGTDEGTFMLQDIAPGPASSGPSSFTVAGATTYFVADDGTTGTELWSAPTAALNPTFGDVHSTYWAWRFIEALVASGVTGGCGNGHFCPTANVTRAEAAVLLLAARDHAAPPPATGTRFTDVPASYWAARYIEELAAEGITGGCSTTPPRFCPAATLTRAEMAVLLLGTRHETPPPATGTRFTDVPASYWAARWIEQLAADGITSGCGNGKFCPGQPVTRAEMAVFLVAAFNLPLP